MGERAGAIARVALAAVAVCLSGHDAAPASQAARYIGVCTTAVEIRQPVGPRSAQAVSGREGVTAGRAAIGTRSANSSVLGALAPAGVALPARHLPHQLPFHGSQLSQFALTVARTCDSWSRGLPARRQASPYYFKRIFQEPQRPPSSPEASHEGAREPIAP